MPRQPVARLPNAELDHQKIKIENVDAAQLFEFRDIILELPVGRQDDQGALGFEPDPEVERQPGDVDRLVTLNRVVDNRLVEHGADILRGDFYCGFQRQCSCWLLGVASN